MKGRLGTSLLRRGCEAIVLLGVGLSGPPARAKTTTPPSTPSSLAELSLEELANVDVTSVSRREQKLSEAAAAIYVITSEDILHSGATSIPEALRLAPNLEIARVDSNQYAICARGFNTTTSNKLLVLIDGRSVYTPLFSGVFWDAQDVLLTDIDRIEVISGPGGTLWGSNAVNGVINIITRSARDTQGNLLTAAAGNEERFRIGFRHGGKLGNGAAYRVSGKYFDRDATVLADGSDADDSWHSGQGGFRIDWQRGADANVLQGDGYKGAIDQPLLEDKSTDGANLLWRWERSLANDASLQVQLTLDHARRDYPGVFAERRDTVDLDVQHALAPRGRHELLLGGGYRVSKDQVDNGLTLAFLPDHRTLPLANMFVQDEIGLVGDRLKLTLGVRLEHNDYTGWEVQPSARLGWKVRERQLLWSAASRAVRTPSRLDRDLFAPGMPPFVLAGGPDFRSEILLAYEAGWRLNAPRATASVSVFYDDYDHLRTLEPGASGVLVIDNLMHGNTQGLEAWTDARLSDAWRLRAGYCFLEQNLRLDPGSRNPNGTRSEGNDPRHRISLGALVSLGHGVAVDWTLRHVSELPNPRVPDYTTLDLSVTWRPTPKVELSLVGRSLLDDRHPEWGAETTRHEMERAGMLRATWTF
jgi:iron complex outermembrane receptor protein